MEMEDSDDWVTGINDDEQNGASALRIAVANWVAVLGVAMRSAKLRLQSRVVPIAFWSFISPCPQSVAWSPPPICGISLQVLSLW